MGIIILTKKDMFSLVELNKLFNNLHTDGIDTIDCELFLNLHEKNGVADIDKVCALFKEIDTNNDGKISLEDISAWQQKHSEDQKHSENQNLDLLVKLKEKTDMTLTELSLFKGSEDSAGLIYIACKGVIFDVTESPHYKPGSGYHIFVGTDASVALARMNLTGEFLNQWGLIELNKEEQGNLEGFYQLYAGKYPIIGKVIPE